MKTALVTGASSGIGYALSRKLAAEGIAVIVVARRIEPLLVLVESYPDLVTAIQMDLSNKEGRESLLAKVSAKQIDYLVNNAGIIGDIGPIQDLTEERLNSVMQTNLQAPIMLTAGLLKMQKLVKTSRVLNISSVGAESPLFGIAPYCITKSGIDGFTLAAQAEGMLVASVHPGEVDTNMQKLLQVASSDKLPSCEKFQHAARSGGLITAELSADYLYYLLTQTSGLYLCSKKHNIYEAEHHHHWLKGGVLPNADRGDFNNSDANDNLYNFHVYFAKHYFLTECINRDDVELIYNNFMKNLKRVEKPKIWVFGGSHGAERRTVNKEFNAYIYDMDKVLLLLPGYQKDREPSFIEYAFSKWWPIAQNIVDVMANYAMDRRCNIFYMSTCVSERSYSTLKVAKEKGYEVKFNGFFAEQDTAGARANERMKIEGKRINPEMIRNYDQLFSALWPYYLSMSNSARLFYGSTAYEQVMKKDDSGITIHNKEKYEQFLADGRSINCKERFPEIFSSNKAAGVGVKM